MTADDQAELAHFLITVSSSHRQQVEQALIVALSGMPGATAKYLHASAIDLASHPPRQILELERLRPQTRDVLRLLLSLPERECYASRLYRASQINIRTISQIFDRLINRGWAESRLDVGYRGGPARKLCILLPEARVKAARLLDQV